MIDYDGRVIIVTGAGRGLGLAHARALAARGANVVVNDLGSSLDGTGSDNELARSAADQINAMGRGREQTRLLLKPFRNSDAWTGYCTMLGFRH